MRKVLCRLAAILLCLSLLIVPVGAVSDDRNDPYGDVSSDMWSYDIIKALHSAGILPSTQMLYPKSIQTRAEFLSYLYAMDRKLAKTKTDRGNAAFVDVPSSHLHYDAIIWAQTNGIVNGVSLDRFAPDDPLTRESICTILIRYANYAGIKLKVRYSVSQFVDSLRISDYARTAVVACQAAGIINGYTNGFFKPANSITKEESIAVVWRIYDAAVDPPAAKTKLVSTSAGFYDRLYDQFLPVPDAKVPQSDPVDLSYFDQVAFIGDSVSLRLQYYCAATRALGNATFLCAGSLSATNALLPVGTTTVHPSYQGKKMLVEECVAASEAQVVYIMLGINNISIGVDHAIDDLMTLIGRIHAMSPNVKVVIQSVTPMAATSTIISERLNNEQICLYNNKLRELCQENGWYYVDVAEVMADTGGYLFPDYCSDNHSMGIHFTNKAAQVWVDYLITHVPAALK